MSSIFEYAFHENMAMPIHKDAYPFLMQCMNSCVDFVCKPGFQNHIRMYNRLTNTASEIEIISNHNLSKFEQCFYSIYNDHRVLRHYRVKAFLVGIYNLFGEILTFPFEQPKITVNELLHFIKKDKLLNYMLLCHPYDLTIKELQDTYTKTDLLDAASKLGMECKSSQNKEEIATLIKKAIPKKWY
jgi:hypothetical protein